MLGIILSLSNLASVRKQAHISLQCILSWLLLSKWEVADFISVRSQPAQAQALIWPNQFGIHVEKRIDQVQGTSVGIYLHCKQQGYFPEQCPMPFSNFHELTSVSLTPFFNGVIGSPISPASELMGLFLRLNSEHLKSWLSQLALPEP